MDSLTQIVLGAAVGEAVLGKKVGNTAPRYADGEQEDQNNLQPACPRCDGAVDEKDRPGQQQWVQCEDKEPKCCDGHLPIRLVVTKL